jgi:hypothetical protein
MVALGMLGALAWVSPVLGTTTHGTTSDERTIDRWHMLCANGMRALSRYNRILNHWNTVIITTPGRSARDGYTPSPTRWTCAAANCDGKPSYR